MFTGAVAASYYGIPRTTMDIDIVVKIARENLQSQLVKPLMTAEILLDQRKILKAIESSYKIVTLRDKKSRYTMDIILSETKLEKRSATITGLPSFVQTPEDLVLSKLRMIKATVSKDKTQKDRGDIKAILKHTKLKLKALRREAQRQSTLALLDELMNQE